MNLKNHFGRAVLIIRTTHPLINLHYITLNYITSQYITLNGVPIKNEMCTFLLFHFSSIYPSFLPSYPLCVCVSSLPPFFPVIPFLCFLPELLLILCNYLSFVPVPIFFPCLLLSCGTFYPVSPFLCFLLCLLASFHPPLFPYFYAVNNIIKEEGSG